MKKVKIEGIEFNILFKNVRYYRLSFEEGLFYLTLPKTFPEGKIKNLIIKHKRWAKNRLLEYKKIKELEKGEVIYHRDVFDFENMVLSILKEGSKKMGVHFNNIKFRYMKSRWGSCSSKGNISINRYLMFFPYELIEYVVYHELAHLKYKNHGNGFKNFLSKYLHDWERRKKELKLWGLLLKERKFIP